MTPRLQQIDTNLLVALDLLLQERSVSRAAKRRGVTQSAMSQALGRLREIFDDALLVRVGARMEQTPRAQQLMGPLHVALQELQAVISETPPFVPATASRTFRVAATDFATCVVLPPLLARLSAEAPGCVVGVVPLDARTIAEQLAAGDVDLAVGTVGTVADGLAGQALFEESFACLARADHPILAKRSRAARLRAFAAARHVLVTPRGEPGGIVDTALAELGMSRRVVVNVPYFLAAPLIAGQSDLVLTLPQRIAATFTGLSGVACFAPPLALPTFTVHQSWHERFAAEPGLTWLRSLCQRAFADA